MNRRKGTPCACNSDPCSCGSSKGQCIRAINNVSPDPNGDFNIKAGAGISIVQSGDDEITVVNNSDPDAFLAGDNIEFIDNGDGTQSIKLADVIDHNGDISQTGDLLMTGDLSVNGNIVQNGAYYDTHAEHIYTADDYIIMRDGAIAALSAGDYSGFQVKLYDGVNDGRLVIDNTGTARVGDVGDEQPLLTREEAANLNDGALLKWDAANSKAADEGTVGDDTHPVKIVNGVATPINWIDDPVTFTPNTTYIGSVSREAIRFDGRYVVGSIQIKIGTATPASQQFNIGTLSKNAKYNFATYHTGVSTSGKSAFVWVEGNVIKCWIYGGLVVDEEMAFAIYYLADQ